MDETQPIAPESVEAPVDAVAPAGTRRLGLLVTTCLLFAVAFVYLALSGEPRYDPSPAVSRLPATVGPWQGTPLLYCHEEDCGQSLTAEEFPGIEAGDACPRCGSGAVDTAAYAERTGLPRDTDIRKVFYRHADGTTLVCSVVTSGRSRSSIHRPELCLEAGHTSILTQESRSVDLGEGRDPLGYRLLRLGYDNLAVDLPPSWYGYWFQRHDVRTASHSHRMGLMALDRLRYNTIHRWSFIAVSSSGGTPHPEFDRRYLEPFMKDLLDAWEDAG